MEMVLGALVDDLWQDLTGLLHFSATLETIYRNSFSTHIWGVRMMETIFQRSFSFLNGQSNAQVIGGYSGLDGEEYVESYSLQNGLALGLPANWLQKGFNFILDGVAVPYTVLACNLGSPCIQNSYSRRRWEQPLYSSKRTFVWNYDSFWSIRFYS